MENSEKKYDNKGLIAQAGKRNEKIFSQAVKNFENRKNKIKSSLDTKDFNSSFELMTILLFTIFFSYKKI